MLFTEITDDLTGAADSSSYFSARGRQVRICTSADSDLTRLPGQLLSVNLSSRNIAKEEARKRHFDLMKRLPVPEDTVFMKKIGTGFRGNDGSELTGLLQSMPEHVVFVIDNAPDLGTFTLYGHQYCEGQILHKSLYAKDPVMPPTKSYIPEILAEECPFPIGLVDIDAVKGGRVRQAAETLLEEGKRILVFDAVTRKDTLTILHDLLPACAKVFWTGSLGIADGLGEMLFGAWQSSVFPKRRVKCFGFCASAYEICQKQIRYSEERGLQVVRIPVDAYIEGNTGVLEQSAAEAIAKNRQGNVLIVPQVERYSFQPGTSIKILEAMAQAAEMVLPQVQMDRLVLVGGETAQTVLAKTETEHLLLGRPLGPGVAQGTLEDGILAGKEFALKGGSMGDEAMLEKMFCNCEVVY